MKVADALNMTTWQATIHSCAPSSHVITGVAQITIIAARFELRSILPSRCQLLIRRPNVRCSRNHRFRRLDDRANAKAATSRNGVVGNSGTTTPTAPIATQARPVNNQMNRIPAFIPAVHHIPAGNGKSHGILVQRRKQQAGVQGMGRSRVRGLKPFLNSTHDWKLLS